MNFIPLTIQEKEAFRFTFLRLTFKFSIFSLIIQKILKQFDKLEFFFLYQVSESSKLERVSL